MKTVILCFSLSLFFVVLLAALSTIFEPKFPFILPVLRYADEADRSARAGVQETYSCLLDAANYPESGSTLLFRIGVEDLAF